MITGQPRARIITADGVDLPMQPCVRRAEVKIGRLMEQCLKVQRGVFTDYLQLNEIRLINDFIAFKSEHLKVAGNFWKYQFETC